MKVLGANVCMGHTGRALGRVVHSPCASYQEGLDKLTTVAKRRTRYGYTAVLKSMP